ncbi:MAG: hypothetical protein BWY09_02135 [Candidatus Hydrogenedentes bacterium ADurb.Bin179]|nr:MAG: hypothetical protein BWY09_02135 [Candidatus Hydrogenedentes bacterium ADurb.Bin179]
MILNALKRTFTTVDLELDAGIAARTEGGTPSYLNAIRWWNFIEAWAMFALVMAVVWCEYWLDKPDTQAFRLMAGLPGILWMFLLSPLVHYRYEKQVFLRPGQEKHGLSLYFWEFRGLGNPVRYYRGWQNERPLLLTYWKTVLGVLVFLSALYICAAVTFWTEIDNRYGQYYGNAIGSKLLFIAALFVSLNLLWLFVGFPFMLRLDNFTKCLRFIAAFLLGGFIFILLFNLFFQVVLEPVRGVLESWYFIRLRGAPAGERMAVLADPFAIGGQWAGYVTWGWVQQLIFAGYFGVLFSRAFPVDTSRWELTKACLCTATAFCLVHLPNVWLMVFTFLGGFLGTFFFLQTHNLFALGLSHGFSGSLLNKLTPINFSVGAGQMPR